MSRNLCGDMSVVLIGQVSRVRIFDNNAILDDTFSVFLITLKNNVKVYRAGSQFWIKCGSLRKTTTVLLW